MTPRRLLRALKRHKRNAFLTHLKLRQAKSTHDQRSRKWIQGCYNDGGGSEHGSRVVIAGLCVDCGQHWRCSIDSKRKRCCSFPRQSSEGSCCAHLWLEYDLKAVHVDFLLQVACECLIPSCLMTPFFAGFPALEFSWQSRFPLS